MEWLVLWLIFGITSAVIANSKGRSGCGWFALGILFGPFGLIVAFLPDTEKAGTTKKCPDCAEIIKAEARVCKHCGRRFDSS